ncbi:protease SohB [Alteromonas gilva]|uniref:Protease SohB n=1 Tax=Alteromonas gilva TaxID=2987522 RepID=A0ABT5L1R4_9ALTE|nr:protease SohB [Alteromonas gilva]MDC8830965.1 protease SohB [Alteromonas gilva]
MEFLYEYGLFLAKAVTLIASIAIVLALVAGVAAKQKQGKGQLEINSLSDQFRDITHYAQQVTMDKDSLKKLAKEQKKQQKLKKKTVDDKAGKLFVIDFKGSMDAHEVDRLREEVTAVLCIASEKDEVLVKVESGGGVVHGYGLAAAQLQRIRDKGLTLIVAVDKVAASGGYMMACVADKLLASQFAIIGSIGVLAQLPNFHKLLKKNDIDFEQHTAGEYKRTLTVFGENTDEGRDKFREELEAVHVMFKDWVSEKRTKLDIAKVATGEYWYGSQALELGLIDTIKTSDDYIMDAVTERDIFAVKYTQKKNVAEKLGMSFAQGAERAVMRLTSQLPQWFRQS